MRKKNTPNCTRKTAITSRSSAAVESGATKAKSISQRRRWRSRKGAPEDEDDDDEEEEEERRSVFERPQTERPQLWPFISYHVALC